MTDKQVYLPASGISKEVILTEMQAARSRDVDWRDGRVFSLVFKANDDVTGLLKDAYGMFFSENGLNPTAFPSLRRFETEVIAMVGNLLGGQGTAAGNMTTGGTESILMAMLTAREWG
ncbi:MAG: aspartate aminotransferase family protein, partial [Anaerolineae bacterium]|nr:aspartate aminotransferase family protein [Anaerolineae bacterium]